MNMTPAEWIKHTDSIIFHGCKTKQLVMDKLTEVQVFDLFKQIIASGDIMRHVITTDESFNIAQSITYIPYREKKSLEAKIKQLKERVRELEEHFT